MRVWHSPWSWLNEIVALDSVAGNTLIGMLTRLTRRNPFHVALAAIVCVPSPVSRIGTTRHGPYPYRYGLPIGGHYQRYRLYSPAMSARAILITLVLATAMAQGAQDTPIG